MLAIFVKKFLSLDGEVKTLPKCRFYRTYDMKNKDKNCGMGVLLMLNVLFLGANLNYPLYSFSVLRRIFWS
jgi:hypothetical protein